MEPRTTIFGIFKPSTEGGHMNKKLVVLTAVMGLATLGWADTKKEDAVDRVEKATKVVHEIMAAPDKGIPQEVVDHAKCIAVVPHMIKGGFIVGANGGKGVATCRTANGWSAPSFFTVAGGSWGLQIGVEGVDLVMVIQNEKGMQQLLNSKFQIGGDASAAAGPVGRHASAGTDWKMDAEILTYSRAKGVFAGLTLDGAVVKTDEDSMNAVYGPDVSARAALTGKVPPPAEAHAFLAAIRGAKAQAAAANQ
jgi:lipid-binding SYLF domain-containing protein